jgi:polyhydroxybutyrate depolymerase
MGSTVELYKVIGGDHSWPGAIININVSNMDFSASKEIWRFFRKYKLDMLTSVSEVVNPEKMFSIYPNPGNGNYTLSINTGTSYDLQCYDSTGRLIQSSYGNVSSVEFSLPEPGLYIVSLSDGVQTERLRVVYE